MVTGQARPDRPRHGVVRLMRVSMMAVMTLCGRISPGTMGSPQDRRFLEEMRAATEASLLGAATLREGEAEMRGPDGVLSTTRVRALVSASGRLPLATRKIFRIGPPPLIFTGRERAASLAAEAGSRAEVIGLPVQEGGVDLAAACEHLAGRGVNHLLLEGGGKLNYQALRQGVVDELLVTIAPKLSGDHRASSLLAGHGPLGQPFLDLELISCRPATTGELFCRYRVVRGKIVQKGLEEGDGTC